MIEQPRPRGESVAAAFERISDGVTTLVRDHLELARVELRGGLRSARVIAIGVALLLVGYLLLMGGLAALLGRVMPEPAALGLVSLANLVAGAAVLWSASGGAPERDANRPRSPSGAGPDSR